MLLHNSRLHRLGVHILGKIRYECIYTLLHTTACQNAAFPVEKTTNKRQFIVFVQCI